jgi:hypothetical protein
VKNNLRYLFVTLAAAAPLFVAGVVGCSQSKEVGKSSKQLFRGEVGAVVQQSPQQVAVAVDQAIADLKLIRINATTRPSREQVETVVVARNTKDARIAVAYRATKANDGSTRIAITTGMMGNSDLRDQVWDAVRIRLGVLNMANAPQSGGSATAQVYGPPPPPSALQPTASVAE